MSSLTLALRTAQSGITASQAGLDTVSQNVANVNTVGYSRKVINYEQRVVEGAGAGVQVSEITRQVDDNLVRTFRTENSELQNFDIKSDYFDRIQEIFGTPANNSTISHTVTEFIGSLERLAVSPDKGLEQTEVARQAGEISIDFQNLTESIQDLRRQADEEIATIVDEVNRLTGKISQLNDDIIKNESRGVNAVDLRDERDAAIDDLSQYIDIITFQRSDGDIVIFTQAGRTLVDNVPATLTHSSAAAVTATTTHAEGDFAGLFIGAQIEGNDMTEEIAEGQLAGLIEMRDTILYNLQSQLDEYAFELKDVMNQEHNRGAPFPGMQSMSGTRRFVDPDTQTIQFAGGDTRIAVFNSSGEQQASTTLNTIMMDNTYGTAAQAVNGPWTVEEVGETIEDWLQDNGAGTASVTFDGDGQMNINLNSNTLYVSFRDEVDTGTTINSLTFNDNGASPDTIVAASGTFDDYVVGQQITISNTNTANDGTYVITDVSTDGTTISVATGSLTAATAAAGTFVLVPPPKGTAAADATIRFNSDGDLTTGSQGATGYDEEVSGFSYFFGLNDFFVDDIGDNIFDSAVLNNDTTTTAATLTFETAGGAMTGSPLTIAANLTLDELADAITNGVTDLTASVVPDGAGSRLRIAHNNGTDFVLTQASANTLLTDFEFSRAKVRTASSIDLRTDIQNDTSLMTRGQMQWDPDRNTTGEYTMSNADDKIITDISERFTQNHQFDKAGGITNLNISFQNYGAEIVSRNATAAEGNERNVDIQKTLTDTIKTKSDNIRGVNLDEEMGNLIIFQQAFAAAARVVSTIQTMFDALERAV